MNGPASYPENAPRQGMDYGETEDVQQSHAAIAREKSNRASVVNHFSLAHRNLRTGGIFRWRLPWALLGKFQRRRPRPARRPAANKKGGGPQGAAATAETDTARPRQKISGQLRHLSSSQWPWRCRSISTAGWFGVYNRGSRRPGMIVLKGLQGPVTVKGQKFGSAVMQPWDKTLNDQNCRRPDLRAERVKQRQCGDGRANCRSAQGAGQSSRFIHRA